MRLQTRNTHPSTHPQERQLGRSIMEKVRKYYIDIWAPHAGEKRKGVWVVAMSLDGGTLLTHEFINEPHSQTRNKCAHRAPIPSQTLTTPLNSRSCRSTCEGRL